jgi:diacylglycerol kinase
MIHSVHKVHLVHCVDLVHRVHYGDRAPPIASQFLAPTPMSVAKNQKPPSTLRDFLRAEAVRRAESFRAAFSGLRRLIATERHFQIHLVAGVCAIALAALLQFDRTEWLILILTIGLVLVAEGLNSAIERAIDASIPGFHPLAKAAKDIGAGAVLIAAIVSVIIGLLLFLPKLWAIAVGR